MQYGGCGGQYLARTPGRHLWELGRTHDTAARSRKMPARPSSLQLHTLGLGVEAPYSCTSVV